MNCLCPEPIGHRDAPQHCEWRQLTDINPIYWVSDEGDVWGPCGLLSQYLIGSFKNVQLIGPKGKQRPYQVHRLVARAFLPGFEWQRHVRFRDGDKWNCRASNLYWYVAPTQAERWQKYGKPAPGWKHLVRGA